MKNIFQEELTWLVIDLPEPLRKLTPNAKVNPTYFEAKSLQSFHKDRVVNMQEDGERTELYDYKDLKDFHSSSTEQLTSSPGLGRITFIVV